MLFLLTNLTLRSFLHLLSVDGHTEVVTLFAKIGRAEASKEHAVPLACSSGGLPVTPSVVTGALNMFIQWLLQLFGLGG